MFPFVIFFGLHPLINELQLKTKINRLLAFAVKALWFDGALYITWKFIFGITTEIAFIDAYLLPVILVLGTALFFLYDYVAFRARYTVNLLVKRIDKKR